jgi:ArsR family metal-binding transcriptional regulator
MYLDSITLTRTLPCPAEPGKCIIFGKPSRSLDEVIPYLATLPNIIAYNPETLTLTFRRQAGFMTLYPDQVYITKVNDAQEGLELLAALKDAVNATWEGRWELVAMTVARRSARPLDIWMLLPQTNCRQCGEENCWAFACNLMMHNRELEECLPLGENPAFADHRTALETML